MISNTDESVQGEEGEEGKLLSLKRQRMRAEHVPPRRDSLQTKGKLLESLAIILQRQYLLWRSMPCPNSYYLGMAN